MNTFLYEITEQLIEQQGINGLASYTIVVPSRRAMLHVKDCFSDYMAAHNLQCPVQLPRLTTLSILFDELSPLYKIDEIQAVCTLYDIYLQVEKDALPDKDMLPLDVFYGWGRQLVQDFSNIDKTYPLVTAESFLNNAAAGKILEQLDIDEDVRKRLEQLVSNNRTEALSGSKRKEFEAIWANLTTIYQRFREALGKYGYEGARMKAVIEHWEDATIQRKITGQHFVFAGFNYLVPAEKQLMTNLEEAGQATFFWDYPLPDSFTANNKAFKWIRRNAELFGNAAKQRAWEQKEVELVSAVSTHAQAQYAYSWLQQHHQAGDRSAVIICDESVLEQVIYALPQDAENEPNPRFKHINITKGFPLRQTEIYSRLMKWLDEGKSVDEFITETTKELSKNEEGKEPEELVNMSFTELLSKESTFQLLSHLTRFRQMQKDGKIPTNIPQRAFVTLLRRYLGSISFPFHGEPLADVQVTGVLETRAMDFDNLLLLNVEEGVVPNVAADHSYLPYYLRKYYGLQTHEESTDVYAYNFFRLLSRAKHITMTFAGSETGSGRKTMSRFVKQIMTSDNFRVTKLMLLEPNDNAVIVPVEQLSFESSKDGKRKISPSAINTFKECEMKYYLKYVKRIKELREEDVLLSPLDLGTYVHEAIEELYARNKDVTKIPDPIDWSQIKHLEGIQEQHPLEFTTITTYISRIVAVDKELAKKGLQIVEEEKWHYLTIKDEEFGEVRIEGKPDRIDKINGKTRIVDYKTGKLNKDNEFQINIYRLAYKQETDQEVKAVLYACQDKPDKLEHEVAPPKSEETFMDELKDTVHNMLKLEEPQLVDIKKMNDSCKRCPYKLLCDRHPKEF